MNTNSLPQITLYAPTVDEINSVSASAKRRHPQLAARIDKAADILSTGQPLEPVAWAGRNIVHWRIASQSHGGAYVLVNQHCPCQDSRAPQVGDSRRCKHSIAVNLYQKILCNRLNADIRNRAVDLAILEDGTFHVYGYAPKMGIVRVRKVGTAYTFADMASAVRYSMWLAIQQPVVVEWPTVATVAA